jgi:DNA-binding transcriptional regulator PaaX
MVMKREWVLLVYKIPSQPTRLRAQVWRRLQRCGAIYLQDSVSIVPATSELAENMQWIADEIREVGGEAFLFRATTTSVEQEGRIEGLFRAAARTQAQRLLEALSELGTRTRGTASPREVDEAEDEVRRIRQAALKLRLRTHFPVSEEETLHKRLRSMRERVDQLLLRRTRRG